MIREYSEIKKQKIIGYLIKKMRKDHHMSMKQLAHLSGISQQYLSEIERGKKTLSFQTLNQIFIVLEIEFNSNEEIIYEVELKFKEFLECHINCDKKRLDILIEIISNKEWKYSFAFHVVFLCEFIFDYYSSVYENKPEAFVHDFDGIYECFTRIQKVIYLLFEGLYYRNQREFDLAEAKLIESLDQVSSNSDSWIMQGYKGLIHLNLGDIHEKKNNLYQAEEHIKKALFYLKSLNMINYSFDANITLGKIYNKQHRYSKAYEQYYYALRIAKKINDKRYYFFVYSNIASLSFDMKDYNQCIKDSLFALEYDSNNPNLYYYLAWSSLQLNKVSDAQKYYSVLCDYDLDDNPFVQRYRDLIGMRLNQIDKNIVFRFLKDFYKYTNQNDTRNVREVLELIIEFCKENKKYKELSVYQEKLIHYYKTL